jgi:hypothetical protein
LRKTVCHPSRYASCLHGTSDCRRQRKGGPSVANATDGLTTTSCANHCQRVLLWLRTEVAHDGRALVAGHILPDVKRLVPNPIIDVLRVVRARATLLQQQEHETCARLHRRVNLVPAQRTLRSAERLRKRVFRLAVNVERSNRKMRTVYGPHPC